MEGVTVSKMQAVELAKGIVEARDAELALRLQVQEIVKVTLVDQEFATGEDLEEGVDFNDSLRTDNNDDNIAALNLAVDELGNLVEETEEMQLSLIEAARLAHLDDILEHDAQFARSLENTPSKAWEKTGHIMEDPFNGPDGSNNLFTDTETDDLFDSIVIQLRDASTFSKKRSHDDVGKNIRLTLRRAKISTSLNLDETPRRGKMCREQQAGKGKKVLQQEADDDNLADSQLSEGSENTNLEHEGDETDHDVEDGECAQKTCQICFDATVARRPFISLEGCGHDFCETCVSRHAEARILGGGQMNITCLHVGCPSIISYTQLSSLLNSKMLEILTRRQIENAIPESERLYCPFKDCSALLIKPSAHLKKPSSSAHPHPTAVGCVECEVCHRAFCLECAVPWHGDMGCSEYKASLGNQRLLGDEKLLQLAGKQKWRRCKNCGQVVEHNTGCYHMTCLCGHGFCYTCGGPWLGKHGKKCSCPTFTEAAL